MPGHVGDGGVACAGAGRARATSWSNTRSSSMASTAATIVPSMTSPTTIDERCPEPGDVDAGQPIEQPPHGERVDDDRADPERQDGDRDERPNDSAGQMIAFSTPMTIPARIASDGPVDREARQRSTRGPTGRSRSTAPSARRATAGWRGRRASGCAERSVGSRRHPGSRSVRPPARAVVHRVRGGGAGRRGRPRRGPRRTPRPGRASHDGRPRRSEIGLYVPQCTGIDESGFEQAGGVHGGVGVEVPGADRLSPTRRSARARRRPGEVDHRVEQVGVAGEVDACRRRPTGRSPTAAACTRRCGPRESEWTAGTVSTGDGPELLHVTDAGLDHRGRTRLAGRAAAAPAGTMTVIGRDRSRVSRRIEARWRWSMWMWEISTTSGARSSSVHGDGAGGGGRCAGSAPGRSGSAPRRRRRARWHGRAIVTSSARSPIRPNGTGARCPGGCEVGGGRGLASARAEEDPATDRCDDRDQGPGSPGRSS